VQLIFPGTAVCLIIGLHLQVPVFEQISDNQWGIRYHCSPYT
jgi:hypothetical protein